MPSLPTCRILAGAKLRFDAPSPTGSWAGWFGAGSTRSAAWPAARRCKYLMPLVAGVVAWWATSERFTSVKLLGAALTLAGVALAQFSVSRPLSDPRPAA